MMMRILLQYKIMSIYLVTLLGLIILSGNVYANTATNLFKKIKKSVYLVKTAMKINSPKVSYGSGFAISKDGLIITNYHVIFSVLNDKNNENKVFVEINGKDYLAKILNIDIIHDLALLKITGPKLPRLKISTKVVSRGEKIFSIGVPKDLSMSINEGNYNGIINQSPYEQIHMSTTLNSGMSGGPTIDEKGNIIGVNVAYLKNSQNISFAIPSKYILKLLKNKNNNKFVMNNKKFHAILKKQIIDVQESLTQNIFLKHKNKEKRENKLGGWSLPTPSKNLKCWSQNASKFDPSVKIGQQFCNMISGLYVDEETYTGNFDINYFSIENKLRNLWQYYYFLYNFYNFEGEVFDDYFTNQMVSITIPDCREEVVINKYKIPFKVNYCIKGYVNIPGIYDVKFKAINLSTHGKSILLRANLRGFARDNIKKFIGHQLSMINWEDNVKN